MPVKTFIGITTQSKFMNFVIKQLEGRKTPIVEVQNKSGNYKLGDIKWYPAWRQYCFMPVFDTVYSKGCLEDINKVIEELKSKR